MEEHIACNGLKTPILVVDDKKENLYSFKTILGKAGLKVVTAPSGTEALKYLLSNPVSLVLLDVQMPGNGSLPPPLLQLTTV